MRKDTVSAHTVFRYIPRPPGAPGFVFHMEPPGRGRGFDLLLPRASPPVYAPVAMTRRAAEDDPQPWLPGFRKCFWQEGQGKRWFPAVVLKELEDRFVEVEVIGLGRRIGTCDRLREYPGRVRFPPRTRRPRSPLAASRDTPAPEH